MGLVAISYVQNDNAQHENVQNDNVLNGNTGAMEGVQNNIVQGLWYTEEFKHRKRWFWCKKELMKLNEDFFHKGQGLDFALADSPSGLINGSP